MFIDYAKIYVKAGQGGSGCVSFHREKYVDKGGPNGGDGGDGGSIIIKGSKQLRTLLDFTYRREYRAKRGQHGMGSNKTGKSGDDIILKVPLGTIVRDEKTRRVLADITAEDQTYVVAKGGKGGRGNARFATPTHRAPREWEVGKPGEEIRIELELKLIADIGLVGLPNAGKSTLLSRITAAKPKIADYPFTTLAPNLGIVKFGDFGSFVVADIPGLIEGAHTGKGLGYQFLRHIERTRALAYLIDVNEADHQQTFFTLKKELEAYSSLLVLKPAMIVITKMDTLTDDSWEIRLNTKLPVMKISAVRGDNLPELNRTFHDLIEKAQKQEAAE